MPEYVLDREHFSRLVGADEADEVEEGPHFWRVKHPSLWTHDMVFAREDEDGDITYWKLRAGPLEGPAAILNQVDKVYEVSWKVVE